MADNRGSAMLEWKRHWPLVAASAIGFSFASFMNPATGLFMEPLQKEFGWSRTLLSAGAAIGAGISLLLSPFFGLLIDRFGTRRLAIPGLICTSVVIAAFGSANGSAPIWLGMWAAFGLASMTIHATTWTTAVAGVFRKSRGLALGITLSGSALALAIVPPLTDALISGVGWRLAFVWMGLGWGGLAVTLSFLFLRDTHAVTPQAVLTAAATSAPRVTGLTIGQAWHDSSLWRVAIATLLTLTITVGVSVHQVPILVDAGVNRSSAAWLAGAAGVAGILGKIVTGLLMDRYHVRWVGGITLGSTAIAYPLLLHNFGMPSLIVVAMIINGYAAGTKMQLCGYLTARYAGMRSYGAIFGFMSSMIALAGGAGPLLAGLAFDRLGGYATFLLAGTVVSIASAVLVFSLGAYPAFAETNVPEPTLS